MKRNWARTLLSARRSQRGVPTSVHASVRAGAVRFTEVWALLSNGDRAFSHIAPAAAASPLIRPALAAGNRVLRGASRWRQAVHPIAQMVDAVDQHRAQGVFRLSPLSRADQVVDRHIASSAGGVAGNKMILVAPLPMPVRVSPCSADQPAHPSGVPLVKGAPMAGSVRSTYVAHALSTCAQIATRN